MRLRVETGEPDPLPLPRPQSHQHSRVQSPRPRPDRHRQIHHLPQRQQPTVGTLAEGLPARPDRLKGPDALFAAC